MQYPNQTLTETLEIYACNMHVYAIWQIYFCNIHIKTLETYIWNR
jgi:hypothetical protein